MAKTSDPQSERQTAQLPVDASGDGAASLGWVKYSVYLAQKIKGGLSPDAADREIRHELDRGWRRFRFVGIDGGPYIYDLPSGYAWSDAKVGLDDSGVWPEEAKPPAAAPLADVANLFKAVDVALGRAARPRRQLNVYQIEVRVPTEAPENSSAGRSRDSNAPPNAPQDMDSADGRAAGVRRERGRVCRACGAADGDCKGAQGG